MRELTNNLFNYATSELSQDAFICWLCSYAFEDANKDDYELVKCANRLIASFLAKQYGKEVKCTDFKLEQIDKQVHGIDVLLSVRYKEIEVLIVIEDKIHTSEHGTQLEDYLNRIRINTENAIGIYFKTGFQGDYSKVVKAGYHVLRRKDILEILLPCKTNNAIFNNYVEYWLRFEENAKRYRELTISDWEWLQINGFFEDLQEELKNREIWTGFGKVNNSAGGFWGFWYGVGEDRIVDYQYEATIYLQLEVRLSSESKPSDFRLCIKQESIAGTVDSEMERIRLRDAIVERLKEYGFQKPSRLRNGKHATVGVRDLNNICSTAMDVKKALLDSLKQYEKLMQTLRRECVLWAKK